MAAGPRHPSATWIRTAKSEARPQAIAAATLRPRPAGFPDIPTLRQPQRKYLGVWQQAWWTWVAKITDRDTHKKHWLGSFHTAELAASEYDRWQVWFHDADARLNFPWGEPPPLDDPPPPGVVTAAVAREDSETRERLVMEAADKAYTGDLRRQYPELVEAERKLFAERAAGGANVIVHSSDEVDDGGRGGGNDGGNNDEDFDIEEWRRLFSGCEDEDTGPDPMGGGMSRADWLELAKGDSD